MILGSKKFVNDVQNACLSESNLDLEDAQNDGLIFYTIDGVRIGVEVNELQDWPDKPPHWIHVQEDHPIREILHSHVQPSPRNGFYKYSNKPEWPNSLRSLVADNPGQAWIKMLRGFLNS